MKQEDKELLLKDLCARLPYEVMVREDTVLYDDKNTTIHRIKKLSYVHIGKGFSRIKGFVHDYEYIYRPYLFPLSSMTEEQKDEYHNTCNVGLTRWGDESYYATDESIDWLNAHHFDYRGLIEKGLALDATGLNIY